MPVTFLHAAATRLWDHNKQSLKLRLWLGWLRFLRVRMFLAVCALECSSRASHQMCAGELSWCLLLPVLIELFVKAPIVMPVRKHCGAQLYKEYV